MNCLSRGLGPDQLAGLLGLTWPWYCSTSRRCGCLLTLSLKRKKIKQKTFAYSRVFLYVKVQKGSSLNLLLILAGSAKVENGHVPK